MIRTLGITCLGLLMAWESTGTAGTDEGVFREIPLDRALQSASEGGKAFVLVDFYTVWCGPCKKLDETTWKDEGVREWLAKQAVCLKVDAEKQEALAEKYRINVYPTLLLLRPDGTEIDRLVGYRDASAFLADAREALAGNDSLSRARKKLEGEAANDPMLRMNYGDALKQKGRAEDALSEYLWCFDHGLEHSRAYVGVRLSFLLSRIVQLSRTTPSALDELRKRRDAAAKAIESGKADLDTAMGFTSLNSNLGEPGRTLMLYDKLRGGDSPPSKIRSYLFEQSLDQLLEAKRYKEVVADSDVVAKARQLVSRHESMKAHMPDNQGLRDYMRKQVGLDGAKYYEALLGAGDRPKAAEVAAILAGFDPQAYEPLIAAARRAGDAIAAEELAKASRNSAGPAVKP